MLAGLVRRAMKRIFDGMTSLSDADSVIIALAAIGKWCRVLDSKQVRLRSAA